ncbi:MAG TPA: hypothetical protein VKR29_07325, partial [Candidatus Binataceae bacterium]|nr:hypothetical protein [Candidatus Binataceae bacterium]
RCASYVSGCRGSQGIAGFLLDEEKMGDQYNSQEPAQRRRGTRRRPEANDYDTLLPIQYYHCVAGGTSPSGEFRLFFAILEDALRCYVRDKHCVSGRKRADFVDARKWFFARGMPHVFSFESVCAHLSIDADWLRRRLESLAPSDLPMKQFHTRRRRLARIPSPAKKSCPAPNHNGNGHHSTTNGNGVVHQNGSTNGNGTIVIEVLINGHDVAADRANVSLNDREASGE